MDNADGWARWSADATCRAMNDPRRAGVDRSSVDRAAICPSINSRTRNSEAFVRGSKVGRSDDVGMFSGPPPLCFALEAGHRIRGWCSSSSG